MSLFRRFDQGMRLWPFFQKREYKISEWSDFGTEFPLGIYGLIVFKDYENNGPLVSDDDIETDGSKPINLIDWDNM